MKSYSQDSSSLGTIEAEVERFIRRNRGVRCEEIAEAFGLLDVTAFRIVDDLRAAGKVGPL